MLDRDTSRLENLAKRVGRKDAPDAFTQGMFLDAGDIEVHVLRVTDAAVEEAEIAAAFDHDRALVRAPRQVREEEQVELLDDM